MSTPARRSDASPSSPDVPGPEIERAWVVGIAAGDEAAFEAMFRAYYQPLYRFAHSYLHEREAAEDVVHDVLFRIWERRAQWDIEGSLKTYLFTATRNRVLDYLRRLTIRRHTAADPAAAGTALRVVGIEERVEGAELAAAMQRAIGRLPERCRHTFLLQRQEGLSYEEVARVMGVSPATVKIQMGRALKALRAALGPLLAVAVTVLKQSA